MSEEVWFRSDEIELYGRLRTSSPGAATIVLLCGLGFHTFEYEPLAALLCSQGFNSFSFDYRGHGRSDGRRGAWTVAELAADTRAAITAIEQRGIGRIGLFGNSLGAMVAISVGTLDDRVRSIVACNGPARIGDFLLSRPRRLLFSVAKRTASFLPMRVSVDHFYGYDQLIPDPAWVARIERDETIRTARRLTFATYRSLLEDWDGPQVVRSLHRPVLVIQGRHDQLQPVMQSRLVFDAANEPRQLILLDTGHLPHLEDTATLAKHLSDWFTAM